MFDEFLSTLMKENCEKLWCGEHEPFSMERINMVFASNYRVSSALHGYYKQVWFLERPFDYIGEEGWRLALDEMIRLIDEEGRLIIRMNRYCKPSLCDVKNFLWRRIGIDCSLEYEVASENDEVITVYKVKRTSYDIYKDDRWSFIMLTMGDKVENVTRFLKSVRDLEKKENEIIICGPHNNKYDEYNVRYVDWNRFKDSKYAEISKKKNVSIEMASNENLLILHDRYVLNDDFFIGFEDYGYDFDYVSIYQNKPDGSAFPAYLAVYGLFDSRSLINDDIQSVYPTSYVNGGCIATKRSVITRIGFNDMMLWGQMEDVELSHVFIENGLPPRVNFLSSATSITMRKAWNDWEKKVEKTSHYNMEIKIIRNEDEQDKYEKTKSLQLLSCIYNMDKISLLDARVKEKLVENNQDENVKLLKLGLIKKIESFDEIFIYGAGKYAMILFDFLSNSGIKNKIKSFIVSGISDNPKEIKGVPVLSINEHVTCDNQIILVGAGYSFSKEIEDKLKALGIMNYWVFSRSLWDIIKNGDNK